MKVPDNPAHVMMPTDVELSRVGVMDLGQWDESMCRLCHGTKQFVGYIEGSRTEACEWECNCVAQLVLERWMQVRGIASNWQRLRWADMNGLSVPAVTWMNDWLEAWRWNLDNGIGAVLFGGSGAGKTGMSMLMMKSMMSQGHDGFVLDSNGIIDMVGWSGKEDREATIRKVASRPIMLFDDLGREAASLSSRMSGGRDAYLTEDMLSDIVQRIIRLRVASRRPTLITTNFTHEQLASMYGPVINDLINECSSTHDVSIEESWRTSAMRERLRFERDNRIMRPVVWG